VQSHPRYLTTSDAVGIQEVENAKFKGTAGKRENCQVGVFLCYSSEEGAAFIDRAMYLPREKWAEDPARREEAGIPKEVRFATKGKLAKEMLERAFEARVPARWVADTVYGTARGLRGWLEVQGCSYVLALTGTHGVYHEGHQRRARTVAKRLPEEAWFRASAGKGSKGERLYDWACVPLPDPDSTEEAGRWLLLRRNIDDPEQDAYYLAYGPAEMPVRQLIRIAGRRWQVEDCFEAAKGEVGLDDYEVRKWDGWHRHTTLCLLAHAYLAVVRSVAEHEEGAGKRGISTQRISTPS
jgi:SRSO17 transposase